MLLFLLVTVRLNRDYFKKRDKQFMLISFLYIGD